MPSIVDNTPYTVYECLFSGIPFVASNIPSIASIIAHKDRAEYVQQRGWDRRELLSNKHYSVLFETNAISLALKLEGVLDNGMRRAG